MLYGWLTEERMTIRQILKRLNFGPWLPRSGHHPWSASTVHHILSDPVYTGTAYANRYAAAPARRPRSPRSRAGEPNCRRLRPKDEWIAIPVPAIIDPDLCSSRHQMAGAKVVSTSASTIRRAWPREIVRATADRRKC
jgi:site-specific DNA recombinase